jgi:hypothetical protein
VAGAADVVAVTRALLDAGGAGLAVQSAGWAVLALAAAPALRLDGAPLRLVGAAWLSAAAAVTVLGPSLVGAPPVPFTPTVVAVILTAILIGVRSVVPAPGRNGRPRRGDVAP